MDLVIRLLIGGVVVSLFAVLGDVIKPKSLAGTTAAAPAVALATAVLTLHQKGEHLYAEIRPDQFNQPLLLPVTIARGLGQAGTPVSEDDVVLVFRRVGNKVQLVGDAPNPWSRR